jgi:capsular polysaccharide biosynthesis protein
MNKLSKITMQEYIKLKKIQEYKFNPIDYSERNFCNKYHTNLYDPLLCVAQLKDCYVSRDGFVVTSDGFLLEDTGYKEKCDSAYNSFDCEDITVDKVLEDAILIGGHANYYHWLLNWLPRKFLSDELDIQAENYLVNSNFTGMQQNVAGTFFPEKINFVPLVGWFKVERLFLPTFFTNPIHSPYVVSRIRSAVKKYMLKSENNTEKLYVSRDDVSLRKIINEDELVKSLQKFGYRKVVLSELSFIEQIKLFSSAKSVVAPHGAGLVNQIFGNKFETVIEIQNDFYTKVFWSLGELIGCKNYKIYKATPVPVEGIIDPKNFNIHVDVEHFINEMKSFL